MSPSAVRIGTYGLEEHSSELEDCRLLVDGLWTPDLDTARQELRGDFLRRAVAEPPKPLPERASSETRPAIRPTRTSRPAFVEEYLHVAGVFSFLNRTVRTWQDQHPESRQWSPPQGWGWTEHLNDQDQVTARFFAYLACRIYAAGPTTLFEIPGVSDLDGVGRDGRSSAHRAGRRRWRESLAAARR